MILQYAALCVLLANVRPISITSNASENLFNLMSALLNDKKMSGSKMVVHFLDFSRFLNVRHCAGMIQC